MTHRPDFQHAPAHPAGEPSKPATCSSRAHLLPRVRLPARPVVARLSVAARMFALSLLMLTAACSSNYVPSLIKPYRPDIQQGNVVIQSTLAQLKPGMSQEQVRFILGSPLLVDPFHPERWDYVFRYQKGTGEVETNRITIVFKDGLYTGHSGVPLPDNRR